MLLRQKYAVGFWIGVVTLDMITVVYPQLTPGMREPPPPPPPPVITFGQQTPNRVSPSAGLSIQPNSMAVSAYYRSYARLTGGGRQTAALPVDPTPQKQNYNLRPSATQGVQQYINQRRYQPQYRPQNRQPRSTQYKSPHKTL